MQLPRLTHPERYVGLFVIDFGDRAAIGYTGEEVAGLLDSPQYRDAKAYRIARAGADGRLELVGVPSGALRQQTGLFFHARSLERAKADYQILHQAAQRHVLPCPAKIALWRLGQEAETAFVVALVYASEFDAQVSRWMLDHEISIGEQADGGPGRLKTLQHQAETLESDELSGSAGVVSRSPEQVLAAVDDPVQRIL